MNIEVYDTEETTFVGVAKKSPYGGYEDETIKLYPNYVAWCESVGLKPHWQNVFSRLLVDLCRNQLNIDVSKQEGRDASSIKGLRLGQGISPVEYAFGNECGEQKPSCGERVVNAVVNETRVSAEPGEHSSKNYESEKKIDDQNLSAFDELSDRGECDEIYKRDKSVHDVHNIQHPCGFRSPHGSPQVHRNVHPKDPPPFDYPPIKADEKDQPITRDYLERTLPPEVAGVPLSLILDEAHPGDYADLLNPKVLEGLAAPLRRRLLEARHDPS